MHNIITHHIQVPICIYANSHDKDTRRICNGWIAERKVRKRSPSYSDIYSLFEPRHEENQQCGFWPGLTQTRLYSYWRWLEAWNFVFRKKRYCSIQVAKTKALISFAVTAKLICVFVFAYADCWFSYDRWASAWENRYFLQGYVMQTDAWNSVSTGWF